jgi:hypothetical protein
MENRLIHLLTMHPITHVSHGGRSLWAPQFASALSYRPIAILNSGFATHPVTTEQVEAGDEIGPLPDANSDAVIAYVRAIGLRGGDVQQLRVIGPDGNVFAQYTAPSLEHDMAQYTLMAGRKRTEGRWPTGAYRASYRVERNGSLLLQQSFEMQL